MKKFLALLLLSVPCFANGPKYVGPAEEPTTYQETVNIYHDISNPVINIGVASTMTVTYLKTSTITAIGFTAQNSTFSFVHASTGTFDVISVSSLNVSGTAVIPWMTDWKSVTLAATGFGTISNNVMYCRRIGDSLECRFYFDAGTVSASQASITLPNSLSIDTAKIPPSDKGLVGVFTNTSGGLLQFFASGIGGFLGNESTDSTQIYFMRATTDASNVLYQTTPGTVVMNSNGGIGGTFTVPISGWTTGNSL